MHAAINYQYELITYKISRLSKGFYVKELNIQTLLQRDKVGLNSFCLQKCECEQRLLD